MRFAPLVALPLLFAAAASAQDNNGRRPRRPEPMPANLQNVTFQEATYKSAAVGKDMPYGVYLPKGYADEAEAKTQWPLVIWLHGMFEDHMRFHNRGGAAVLDRAIGDGLLPPCVFVLADGGRTSMYVDAGDGKNYQQLVQHDLLEHVLKTYRVKTDRKDLALMGISMGGMAALRIGFTHPELFGTIAVHSSAVFPADPKQLPPQLLQMSSRIGLDEVFGNPIDEDLWAKTNPLSLAAHLDAKKLGDLRLYFDAGTDDRFRFGDTNEAMHKVLVQQKVEHTWTLVDGGGHAWGSGFKDESLLASLKFVGDGFRAASGDAKAPAKDDKPAPADGSGKH